jgi:CheY-like chemotaxis protein
MNSYKATKELGAKGVKTEIIGLSGNALEEDLNTFKEKGFDEYLTKLLKFDVLKKAFQSKE